MKLFYVAHKYGGDKGNVERAQKLIHALQVCNTSDCYVCPLAVFSHLGYKEIGYDAEIALCLELLKRCDGLIIASEISKGVAIEIDFALKHNIPIYHIEDLLHGKN